VRSGELWDQESCGIRRAVGSGELQLTHTQWSETSLSRHVMTIMTVMT
jgi:hypothetical protein